MFVQTAVVLFLALAGCFAEDSIDKCPSYCTLEYNPVCAADNGEIRTFSNECTLSSYNCQQRKSLKKISDGECPSLTRSETSCTNHCTRDYRPVCGVEDGELKTFGNACMLGYYNCVNRKSFKKIGDGECPQITRNSADDCNSICTFEFNPVCAGTNGEIKTFGNECFLRNYNCQQRKSLKVISFGVCPQITRNTEDQCTTFCTLEYKPLCAGENGEIKTFANDCALNNYNCLQRKSLKKISSGICPQISRNEDYCPLACTLEYKPVCGSADGELKTFGNECALRSFNCQQGKVFQLLSDGECPQLYRL